MVSFHKVADSNTPNNVYTTEMQEVEISVIQTSHLHQKVLVHKNVL